MLVIAIVILAVILLALISKRQPKPAPPVAGPQQRKRDRDASDGLIYGETPNGVWEGGPLPPDFTPGGGDFGGAGSSGSWGSDAGDGGGGSSD